mmetsp:Transcript_9368/g.21132  ORF Transcript_9368/g.21132 Transcript_9368/m.21132 type:complete len:398 (+) Transcript_9368:80-1273(+)
MILLLISVLLQSTATTTSASFLSLQQQQNQRVVGCHHRHRSNDYSATAALFSSSPPSSTSIVGGSSRTTSSISLLKDPAAAGDKHSSLVLSSSSSHHQQQQEEQLRQKVRSVNYFISRSCNYKCKFCFHTAKTSHHLALEQAKLGLEMLRKAGTEKINFAGGEPFLQDQLLGELCKTSHELGLAVSIISNGSKITQKWMEQYGQFVDVLGVSVDSFNPLTNAAIGRGGDANNEHISRVLNVQNLCSKFDITFKMNTVVCSLNWEEDMNQYVHQLDPKRWKVFQVLILEGENSGMGGDLRDARALQVTDEQFLSFVHRHRSYQDNGVLIPEPNNVMQNSYLLLDEDMRFLDCSSGGKVPSDSILKVGVRRALEQSGFDENMFHERGGIYDWERDRSQG